MNHTGIEFTRIYRGVTRIFNPFTRIFHPLTRIFPNSGNYSSPSPTLYSVSSYCLYEHKKTSFIMKEVSVKSRLWLRLYD